MSQDTTFEIILKNFSGVLNLFTNQPLTCENSKGETVPVTFTVGCKFKFGDDLYGDYVVFLGDEPGPEAIGEAAESVFGLALKSYKMLRSGARDVPMHQVYSDIAPDPIKTIESGRQREAKGCG